MGCSQSKEATGVIEPSAAASKKPPEPKKEPAASCKPSVTPPVSSKKIEAPCTPATTPPSSDKSFEHDNGNIPPPPLITTQSQPCNNSHVEDSDSHSHGSTSTRDILDLSRHSDILNTSRTNKRKLTRASVSSVGLDEMIENHQKEGSLLNKMVHIETPFGKPIEEVYDGVHTGDVLGSGVSGLVRKVTHRTTGIEYAVKCLDLGLLETEESLEQLRQEIFIMCQLDHPNIVRLEEVYESTSEIYLVQELCRGGELFDRLDEQPDYHYTEAQCARLVKQMLCAVRYIHSKEIVHRDLKLENFLFTTADANSELKMIDFGLSKHFEYGELQHEAVGTPYTVAPEVILGSYDERCDVWGIGVITYLLLSGDPPFGGCGGPEPLNVVRKNILEGSFSFEPVEIWQHVSKEAKSFIKSLLVTDPKKRPTALDAQESPWLKKWLSRRNKSKAANKISPNVVGALVKFKEYSDMRKLLCEVLSFTLVPEQIKQLRDEFEKMDDGSGEISIAALKEVLLESAGSGSLGALTEEEVTDIFNAMRVRKTETKIHWHEFIAAGLSQCEVDDRNLRLAFERLDKDHKGFINFEDILDIMGDDGYGAEESYRKMFLDGLSDLRSKDSILNYEDFILLMKGQSREPLTDSFEMKKIIANNLRSVPETRSLPSIIDEESVDYEGEENNYVNTNRLKAKSFDQGFEKKEEDEEEGPVAPTNVLVSISLPEHEHDNQKIEDLIHDESKTALVVNRNLYREHRQMRLGLLEACKRFDEWQQFRIQEEHQKENSKRASGRAPVSAGLVMKHGTEKRLSTEDIRKVLHERQVEQQQLLDKANKLSGRGNRNRRNRKKTVSDMSAMLGKKPERASGPIASNSEKNLMVHHTSTSFKMTADSRSCPPSPALEAQQTPTVATSVVVNEKSNLPFLPNMSLDEDDGHIGGSSSAVPFLTLTEPATTTSIFRQSSLNNKDLTQ